MFRRGRRGGQALVEAAIVFPLFMMLFLGAVDFGRGFAGGITASNAARQAAAYAAQHQADGSSLGGSCTRPWGKTIDIALASGSSLGIACSNVIVTTGSQDPYGRTPITVTVIAPFRAFTPLVTQALGLTQVGGSVTARGDTW